MNSETESEFDNDSDLGFDFGSDSFRSEEQSDVESEDRDDSPKILTITLGLTPQYMFLHEIKRILHIPTPKLTIIGNRASFDYASHDKIVSRHNPVVKSIYSFKFIFSSMNDIIINDDGKMISIDGRIDTYRYGVKYIFSDLYDHFTSMITPKKKAKILKTISEYKSKTEDYFFSYYLDMVEKRIREMNPEGKKSFLEPIYHLVNDRFSSKN